MCYVVIRVEDDINACEEEGMGVGAGRRGTEERGEKENSPDHRTGRGQYIFFSSPIPPSPSPVLLSSSPLGAPTIIRALGKYTGETTSSSARFCPVKIQMRPRGILR